VALAEKKELLEGHKNLSFTNNKRKMVGRGHPVSAPVDISHAYGAYLIETGLVTSIGGSLYFPAFPNSLLVQ
jgi:hypothetical protein